jgi:hypothetical protein
MHEEPTRIGPVRFLRYCLAAQPNRKLQPAPVEGSTLGPGKPLNQVRVGMPACRREALMMQVKLNVVTCGRGHRAHGLPTASRLHLAPWPEADKVRRLYAKEIRAGTQRISDIGLIEERESARVFEPFCRPAKIMNGEDGLGPDSWRVVDGPPRFEMVGVKIGKAIDFSSTKSISKLGNQTCVPAHGVRNIRLI